MLGVWHTDSLSSCLSVVSGGRSVYSNTLSTAFMDISTSVDILTIQFSWPDTCKMQSEQFLSSHHQKVFWQFKGIVRKAEIFYWQASTAKWTLWLAVCINLFAMQIPSQFICFHLLRIFWQLKGLVGKAEIIHWKASTVKWTLCLAVCINLFAMMITSSQTSSPAPISWGFADSLRG